MPETTLFVLQRATALVMAPLVLVHLGMIIYAIRGGVDAAEILSRTQGSLLWGGFYLLFVLCAAIHAAIGLRAVAREWLGTGGSVSNAIALGIGLGLAVFGSYAVLAVTLP